MLDISAGVPTPVSVANEGVHPSPQAQVRGTERIKSALEMAKTAGREKPVLTPLISQLKERTTQARSLAKGLWNGIRTNAERVNETWNLAKGLATNDTARQELKLGLGDTAVEVGYAASEKMEQLGGYLNEQKDLAVTGATKDLRDLNDWTSTSIVQPTVAETKRLAKAAKVAVPLGAAIGTAISTAPEWGPVLLNTVTRAAIAGESATVTYGPGIAQQLAEQVATYGPPVLAAGAVGMAAKAGYEAARQYGPNVARWARRNVVEQPVKQAAERGMRFWEEQGPGLNAAALAINRLPEQAKEAALELKRRAGNWNERFWESVNSQANGFADGINRAAAGIGGLYNEAKAVPSELRARGETRLINLLTRDSQSARLAADSRREQAFTLYDASGFVKNGLMGRPQRPVTPPPVAR